MTQSSSDLVGFFWNHMPRQYLERVLRALFDCYEAADERCQTDFARSEAVNLRPFYRRALIEGQLREIATSFSQIEATARRSPAGPWYHSLVICGQVAMTQNAVGCPDEIVRSSLFRQMYAGRDNQRYLFPELAPAELPSVPMLYGILIHGQFDQSPVFPGFAVIRFPAPDLQNYLPGRIDLFQEFPEVVRSRTEGLFENQGIEQIAEPEPELRFDHRQVDGEA